MTTFRWGIFGTGFVATKFAMGLNALGDAEITAVGSRSVGRAKGFVEGLGIEAIAGSYEDVVQRDDVDAIYIATPPSLHKEHALQCLNAKKPVLIEKPFALNASEALEIQAAAKANDVFCMEAMWTRFTPLMRKIKAEADNGDLGSIKMLTGRFCLAEAASENNHLFKKESGGGALLDRAVYPLSLAVYLMGKPDKITGLLNIGNSGVDEQAAISLAWNSGCIAQFEASLLANANNNFAISGTKKTLELAAPVYRPFQMKMTNVVAMERGSAAFPSKKDALKESHLIHRVYQMLHFLMPKRAGNVSAFYSGNAYQHQAEEVRLCVQAGNTESAIMPISDSISVLEIVDALRANTN